MKKLNTNNAGRMPFWQADLDWMQDAYTQPITALVHELGLDKQYFIITGCNIHQPNKSQMAMDAGWFWWNGQILPVQALPATDITGFNNPIVHLTYTPHTETTGERSFIKSDLTTVQVTNVWQDDYLAPSVVERTSTAVSGVRLAPGAWTLRDIIQHHYAENESDWIPAPPLNPNDLTLQFKRIGRLVVLKGACNVRNTSVNEGLPAPMEGLAVLHPLVAPEDVMIAVNSQGEIGFQWNEQTITLPNSVDLTGMMYMADTPYQSTDPNTINLNSQS